MHRIAFTGQFKSYMQMFPYGNQYVKWIWQIFNCAKSWNVKPVVFLSSSASPSIATSKRSRVQGRKVSRATELLTWNNWKCMHSLGLENTWKSLEEQDINWINTKAKKWLQATKPMQRTTTSAALSWVQKLLPQFGRQICWQELIFILFFTLLYRPSSKMLRVMHLVPSLLMPS